MNDRVKALFAEARKLTSDEREELAKMLLGSLGTDHPDARYWAEEAQRRWEGHVASGAKTEDAFEALEEARQRLRPGANCWN